MSKEQLAQSIFNKGDVNKVDLNTFVCHGSNGNQYQITRVNDPQYNYEFYCKCPAWKFDTTRRCKHVLAVELFEKNNPSGKIKIKSTQQIKAQGAKAKAKQYKVKKRSENDLKNDITWSEPDGTKTKFKFDSEGNLIGRETK